MHQNGLIKDIPNRDGLRCILCGGRHGIQPSLFAPHTFRCLGCNGIFSEADIDNTLHAWAAYINEIRGPQLPADDS